MKKLFSLFALVLFSTSIFAHDFEVDGIYYNFLDGDSVEVTYYGDDSSSAKYTGELSLKSTVTYNDMTYRVTMIGSYAFDDCSGLTGSLTIPEGVTTIGEFAFYDCSGLTGSLTIPEGVTSIGIYAFYGCSGLTGSLTIPESVTTIGYSAFYGCFGLTGSLTIPEGVTAIGSYAFAYCSGLTGSLTIPEGVTTIGDYAFHRCSGIESIEVEQGNEFYYSKGNCLIETASKTLLVGCKNSVIPNDGSIITIGEFAFFDCSGLTGSLTIPEGITTIGNGAFYYCYGLTQITCWATTPPAMDDNAFYGINHSIPLYVPAESIETYKAAEYWSEFTNIQAIVSPFDSLALRVDEIALYPNEKYFLNIVVEPNDVDKSTLIWTSSDTNIATVDSTGFVTALAVGTAQIIVSTPDKALSDTCEVIVLDETQEPNNDVVVDPNDQSVNISWTPVDGAALYVFVVFADETQQTKICTLTFDAHGYLTNIHFAQKKPAANPESHPFNFTVTGLEENTTYGFTMSSYDEEETLITSKAGQFTTTSGTTTAVETPYIASPNEIRKVLENGTIYILKPNGEKYTIDGKHVL